MKKKTLIVTYPTLTRVYDPKLTRDAKSINTLSSRGQTFSTDLRHISAQQQKRFPFGVPIYVTLTDEINQNASRNALAIE